MKLDKNGYQIEKRGACAMAVKILTLIFGVGVVVLAVCPYAIFSGCGSGNNGSDNSAPIYDENDATISGEGGGTTSTGCQNDDECSDEIDCTVDVCQTDGTCVNMPDDKNCATNEICDPTKGGCVKAKSCFNDEQCADEWDCTVEGCKQETNLCFPSIEDNTRCDAYEICKPNHPNAADSGCVSGQACKNDSDCPTKDFCVVGACKLGICEWTPDDSKCDDGIWCNGFETCRPDICPSSPDSGIICNETCNRYPPDMCFGSASPCATCSCDEKKREITVELHDELCDDSDPCTVDVCVESGYPGQDGCQHTPNEGCGG